MKPARIVVADDHALFRRGVVAAIAEVDGWLVVGEAADGREAVELVAQHKPDVVILDLTMPELNGIDATKQIVAVQPATKVLILTGHESEQLVREVLIAGAQGYLLKSDAGRTLPAAIEALLAGQPFFTSRVAHLVLEGYLRGELDASARMEPLSPREREIVQLLAEGHSNKEVARTLGISVKTAETHRGNIMRKMNFESISDLVRYAVRNKFIDA